MSLPLRVLPDGSPAPRQAAVSAPAVSGGQAPSRPPRVEGWQDTAVDYDERIGLANFANELVALTVARCDVVMQERRDDGEWIPSENTVVNALWEEYRNEWESSGDLRNSHTWCYQVPGEGYSVVDDGEDGAEWFVYRPGAVRFDRERVTCRDRPDQIARVVDAEQVRRFWLPSRRWRALARSPMRAILEDLRRYKALTRYETSTAESRFIMSGIQWFPDTLVREYNRELEGGEKADLVKDFRSLAEASFRDEHHAASVVPFMLWGPSSDGAPKFSEVGRGLDPKLRESKEGAILDTARGMNMPQDLVTGGGASQGNHWSAWLVREEFWASTMAPLADRVHHHDITDIFLRPRLRALGMSEAEVQRVRVGYDPANVIVRDDRSEFGLRSYTSGLVSSAAAREAGNWEEADAPTEADIQRLERLRTRTQPDGTGGPANVDAAPPEEPVQAAVSRPALHSANERLIEARRTLIGQLRAAADVALTDALRRAGVKLQVRASKRARAVQAAVDRIVETGVWGADVLAAVGATERELLDRSFETFDRRTRAWLEDYDTQRRRELGLALNVPVPPPDPERSAAGASFLTSALTASAYAFLRGDPQLPSQELISTLGPVQHSDVLATVDVLEGRAVATLGATAEVKPSLRWTGTHALAPVFLDAGVTERWAWATGASANPFEPHHTESMAGLSVTAPDFDDAGNIMHASLSATDISPGDHNGCQCRWDIEVVAK